MHGFLRSLPFLAIPLILLGCGTSHKNSQWADLKAAPNPDALPLKDFFRNPERGRFKVSRDGRMISFMKAWNNRMNLFVQNLSSDRLPDGAEKQVTFVKDRDIDSYFWKGRSLIYMRDFNGDENYHVFTVDLATGIERDVTPFPKARAGVIDDLRDVSSTDVLITLNKRNPEIFDVFRLNVLTGRLRLVAENPGKVVRWVTDHAGRVRMTLESDGLQTRISARKGDKGAFQKILEFDYTESFEPLVFAPDNEAVYALSNLSRDKSALVRVDTKTGKEIDTLFSHPEVDASGADYSRKRRMLTGARYTTWKDETKFFDPVSEARFKRIKNELGEVEIYLTSSNKDEDLFTFVATNDKTRGNFYLYDDRSKNLTFLANSSPWLNPSRLASTKPIQYRSRDGLTIHGYLTLPLNSHGKKLPVIIHPHGGPWSRDVWGYNPEVQFLANRGFAVLQMNFRGSTGYGKEFFTRSFKQWGRAMQNDITDGVQWLIADGVADRKRIGIYGGSYGGYATLAGVAFTPDLYAAALDYVGVSNLFTFLNTIPPYWRNELDKLRAMVGDPIKDKDLLEAASPVFHVDRIKTPLLVVQGAHDPRVNIDESNQIVNALRKRGIAVEYIVKENEGHGFRNEENRFEFYSAMERFFREHLGRTQ